MSGMIDDLQTIAALTIIAYVVWWVIDGGKKPKHANNRGTF